MTIKRVDGFMTTDGKVFANETDAIVAEHDYHLHSKANALAERIKPAYGTMYTRAEDIASELLDNLNDVLLLADAIRVRWPEPKFNYMEARREALAMATTTPTAHAPVDGPAREDH